MPDGDSTDVASADAGGDAAEDDTPTVDSEVADGAEVGETPDAPGELDATDAGCSEPNACGFCGELPGIRGELCSCDGLGNAVWICGDGEMLCADGDDGPGGATLLGGLGDFDAITWPSSWTDSPTDVDWFELSATDLSRFEMEPGATVETSDSGGINYEVCLFFRSDETRVIGFELTGAHRTWRRQCLNFGARSLGLARPRLGVRCSEL